MSRNTVLLYLGILVLAIAGPLLFPAANVDHPHCVSSPAQFMYISVRCTVGIHWYLGTVPFSRTGGMSRGCVVEMLAGGWTPLDGWTAAAYGWAQHRRLVGRFDSREEELYRRSLSTGKPFAF